MVDGLGRNPPPVPKARELQQRWPTRFVRQARWCCGRLAAAQQATPASIPGGKDDPLSAVAPCTGPEDDFALTPTSPQVGPASSQRDGGGCCPVADMVVPSSPERTATSAGAEGCDPSTETCALCGIDLGGKNIAERLAHGDECFEKMQLLEESKAFAGASSRGVAAPGASPASLLSLVEESDDEDFKDTPSVPSQCSDRGGSGAGVCPVCSKTLKYASEQRRSQHVSRCLEAQEKKERDAAEEADSHSTANRRKGKGKRKKRFTPQTERVRHACTACDQDLTSMNQGERIKHYKRCHAQRGTRLQVLQQVRGIKDSVRHISTTPSVTSGDQESLKEMSGSVESPLSLSPGELSTEDSSASSGGSTQAECLTPQRGRGPRTTRASVIIEELAKSESESTTKQRKVSADEITPVNEKLASVTGGMAYTKSVRKLPMPQPLPAETSDTEKGPAGFSVPLTPQEREETRKKALDVMFDATQLSPSDEASPTRARASRLTALPESRLANSAARAPRSLWKMSTAIMDVSDYSSIMRICSDVLMQVSLPEETGAVAEVAAGSPSDEVSEQNVTDDNSIPRGVGHSGTGKDEMRARVEAVMQSYNEECARLHELYVSSIGRAAIERDRRLRELCTQGSASVALPWTSLSAPEHPSAPEVQTAPPLGFPKPLKRTRSEPQQPQQPTPSSGQDRKKRKLSLFAASERSSGSSPAKGSDAVRNHEMELLSPTPQSGSSM